MTGMETSTWAGRSSSGPAWTCRAPSGTGCASVSRSITSPTRDSTTGIPGSTLWRSFRRFDQITGIANRPCARTVEPEATLGHERVIEWQHDDVLVHVGGVTELARVAHARDVADFGPHVTG